MMTEQQNATFKAYALSTMTEQREKVQFMLDRCRNSLVSHGWLLVIRHKEGSLTVLDPVIRDRKMVDAKFSSVTKAGRLTKQDADLVCANCGIRNGAGETAEPMHEQDALRHELAHLDRLIQQLA